MKKRSEILLINLIIVGEMKLYPIVYGRGLLPPWKYAEILLFSVVGKLKKLNRRDNHCSCLLM